MLLLFVIKHTLLCTLKSSNPKITLHPASCNVSDQFILFSSSNLAFNSIKTVTSLLFSAAVVKYSINFAFLANLYIVIFIDGGKEAALFGDDRGFEALPSRDGYIDIDFDLYLNRPDEQLARGT